MSADKISDIIADLRLDPKDLGKRMGYQDKVIQDRFMEVCTSFLRELAIQKSTGGFVNGNIETAQRAWEIQEILLTSDTPL